MHALKKLSRVLAIGLSALMITSSVAISASAVEKTANSLTIASQTKTKLAPGVTETSVVSYDKNGKRVQYFVVDCDVNNGTTQVKANYHDNDNTGVWGKATVVEQANAAKAKRGYNVVATTNAAYYNVTTGQPSGAFVMEGVNINGTATGNSYQFFAQLDDGSYMIGDKGEFGSVADRVVEAVAGHLMLVKDGAVISNLDAVNKYPRSTVGLKADGSVVLMLADGNNQPYSIGLTYAEQAQLMLELGCVDAIELDGGGSATYAAKPEGSDEIEVRNVCCDGTVRSVSNTLMVISTAVSDGTFDHANLSTEYAYNAPNADVQISATGADAAGGFAEIPEGVTWSLTEPATALSDEAVTDGYYLVGSMTDWQPNAAFKLAENPNNQGEYMLDFTLAENAEVKAVQVAGDTTTWIPGGDSANITVAAGAKTVYFRPEETANEDWVGPGKHFYFADKPGFGTIKNGVFHSTGRTGTVTANMLYNDSVVGSIDITVVNPTSFAFSADEKTVPYGKTANFEITAMYNGAEVYAPAGSYDFTVSAGSMDGFIYSSPTNETIPSGTVTAAYKYAQLPAATVNVIFGKGSEVLFDFEDGDVSDWTDYYGMVAAAEAGTYTNGYTNAYSSDKANNGAGNFVSCGTRESTFLATKENGKVHSGNYALGYTYDYTQASSFQNWMYGYLYYLGDTKVFRDVETGVTGTRIGMWMYIPEEAVGSCSRLAYTYKNGTTLNTAYLYFTYQYVKKGFSKLTSDKIPEAGWAYVYCDLDDISSTYVTTSYYKKADGSLTRASDSNYAPAFIQWIVSSSAKGAEKVTFYIDDITLDYSDVVDDRDAPVISNPLALDDLGSYALNGGTVNTNVLSFTADAAEDTAHNPGNATGLDGASAKVYVDGQEVACKFSAGKINTGYFTLPNGIHDVSFEIADKQGNVTKMTRQITVASDATYPTVSLVGQALAEGKVKTGAQYNLLINTNQAEKINKITTTIWLNSASKWALEHATPAAGFSYDYTIDEVACKADITITNDGSNLAGEQTLLSIPVYAWAWDGSAGHDAHTQWTSGAPKNGDGATCPAVTISYKAFLGEVEYTEGSVNTPANYVAGFSNIRQDVATELDSSIANLKNTIGEWHYHTEVAAEDKAATCTEEGYTGRTVCSDCHSVVNWGEPVPATGHTYEVVDGSLKCKDCGEPLSGLVELDGNTYYSVNGNLMTGWQQVGNDWYYFDTETYAGVNGDVKSKSVVSTKKDFTFNFVNGKLTHGVWVEFEEGWRYYYGPKFYQGRTKVSTDAVEVIDGDTYAFDMQGIRFEGISLVHVSAWTQPECWVMGADGKFIEKYTGLYDDNGTTRYYIDGVVQKGAFDINGDIYYFSAQTYAPLADGNYYITKELMNDVDLPAGKYAIKDGKIAIKNGLVTEDGKTYYYVDNNKITGAVQVGDEVYYFGANTKTFLADGSYYISKELMNDVNLPAGTYAIKDGKLVKEGLVVKDGKTYYYKNYAKITGAVQVGDDIYYFGANTKTFLADGKYYVSKELMNDVELPAGSYEIKDGKLVIKNGIYEEDGKTYYYRNNKKVKGAVQVGNDIYYFSAKYNALPDGKYYISEEFMNGLLPAGSYQIKDFKIVL